LKLRISKLDKTNRDHLSRTIKSLIV